MHYTPQPLSTEIVVGSLQLLRGKRVCLGAAGGPTRGSAGAQAPRQRPALPQRRRGTLAAGAHARGRRAARAPKTGLAR